MALYRRGRLWYADYYADGVRVQESTGTANKREAEKILVVKKAEAEAESKAVTSCPESRSVVASGTACLCPPE